MKMEPAKKRKHRKKKKFFLFCRTKTWEPVENITHAFPAFSDYYEMSMMDMMSHDSYKRVSIDHSEIHRQSSVDMEDMHALRVMASVQNLMSNTSYNSSRDDSYSNSNSEDLMFNQWADAYTESLSGPSMNDSPNNSMSSKAPLICQFCNKACFTKAQYSRHLKIHSVKDENRRFVCALCGSEYTYKYNLKRHLKKTHQLVDDLLRKYLDYEPPSEGGESAAAGKVVDSTQDEGSALAYRGGGDFNANAHNGDYSNGSSNNGNDNHYNGNLSNALNDYVRKEMAKNYMESMQNGYGAYSNGGGGNNFSGFPTHFTERGTANMPTPGGHGPMHRMGMGENRIRKRGPRKKAEDTTPAIFECHKCTPKKTFSTKWSLRRHILNVHKIGEESGENGPLQIPQLIGDSNEVDESEKKPVHTDVCPICNEQFICEDVADGDELKNSAFALRVHLKEAHQIGTVGVGTSPGM